jgi:hypothetical protein
MHRGHAEDGLVSSGGSACQVLEMSDTKHRDELMAERPGRKGKV